MRIAALALALALTACAPPTERRQLTGTLSYGFEHNSFEPAAPDESWCLAQESVQLLGVERPPRNVVVAVDLTIDAEISAPGRYGHMGMCTREVRIIEIIQRGEQYCPSSPEVCAWQATLNARD